jgi:A/G-specific adenine glycosylase
MSTIAGALLAWFDRHGRHDLPWQAPRDAYRVWLSEIMLQQTQVATVIPYFARFVEALPTLRDLAAADEDRVLALWSGLGYYRRARFLHRAAKLCVERHGGELPRDFEAMAALPGIGRSTAGAILAQAHGLRFPILDGNVKRVLARYHGIRGYPGQGAVEKQLWQRADEHTPGQRVADYTQAIMDLGATVCVRSRPLCGTCPLAADCVAHREHLTDVLPEARPAKALPTRQTVMLVLRDDRQRVLLQRRGPQGVWSGLWSLPEAVDDGAARQLARRHARFGESHALPPFTHVFSHYRLQVAPLLFTATPRNTVAETDDDARWYARDEALALGLPAPVRSLLQALWDPADGGPAG